MCFLKKIMTNVGLMIMTTMDDVVAGSWHSVDTTNGESEIQ